MAICQRCYRKYLAFILREAGKDAKKIYPHADKFVSRCQVVRFESNAYGHQVAVKYDCRTGRDVVMSMEEFRRKRNAGEL